MSHYRGGGRGVRKKSFVLLKMCPIIPWEGGTNTSMGPCPIIRSFFLLKASLSQTRMVDSTHGHKLVQWFPKTSVGQARTVESHSGDVPDECPVVYRKWPSPNDTNGIIEA